VRKSEELITIAFIERRICPLLRPGIKVSASDCITKIVRNNGTGRLTIQYSFDSDVVVYAKLYDNELGVYSYKVNQSLWENGFNEAGRFRVPQPLGFLDDYALLVMLGVQGTSLGVAFDSDSSIDLVAGSYAAAEWLATLHLSIHRAGVPERNLESLKQCWATDLVMKAISVRPDKADMIRELIELLERCTAKLPSNHGLVLTHGRYHHDHVFLSTEATSVIDLDRCRPSNPAKDVAEFIRLMRLSAFTNNLNIQKVELAISQFLSYYMARLPHVAECLGCYLAAFSLHSLLCGLKQRSNIENKGWKHIEEFHVGEIQRALKFRI